jgi:hypothetical protein
LSGVSIHRIRRFFSPERLTRENVSDSPKSPEKPKKTSKDKKNPGFS